MPPLSRRELFRAAPLAAVPLLAGVAVGQEPPVVPPKTGFPGMTVRQQLPHNLEMPLAAIDGPITPNDRFFVRSHFAVPKIDAKTWKLRIEGHVETPLEFTLDELKKWKAVSKSVTVECAGNGRVFLTPAAHGLQWGFGGVSTANWVGVPLAELLDRAKPKAGAAEVILVGTDKGSVGDPASPGPVNFDRGIPIGKATSADTLLAYGMNDADLPVSHGAPVRAVVGGWYGMASVKWLTRIVVTDTPYLGYWQTASYSYYTRRDGGLPQLNPVTAILPKAILAAPTGPVAAGKKVRLFGAAWAGENKVGKVEVSVNGGKSWLPTKVNPQPDPLAWTFWELDHTFPNRGPVQVLARCTDAKGQTQPDARDTDRRSYMVNHLIPVEVMVQ
jgi:DMSO/TMAO reductase YedYZ molybdopterin-dependent catalytic subunit